jgi:hypothetical protein
MPAIEQAGDVGMAQVGQCLAFAAKQRFGLRIGPDAAYPLQRDLLRVRLVCTLGHIDDGHAAARHLADDPVRADQLPRLEIASAVVFVHQRRSHQSLQGATSHEVLWVHAVVPAVVVAGL